MAALSNPVLSLLTRDPHAFAAASWSKWERWDAAAGGGAEDRRRAHDPELDAYLDTYDTLPADQALVYWLRYRLEATSPQIALATGWDELLVRRLLLEARETLGAALASVGGHNHA